jgi:hypothetical protein
MGSKNERKAMQEEITRQILAAEEKFASDIDAMVLYTLHERFGFGPKRLHDFWIAFQEEHEKLVKHYEMPDSFAWLCDRKLKEIGVDIEAWRNEEVEKNDGSITR